MKASVRSIKAPHVLWEKGLLGDNSPRVLQYTVTVFYYAGMQFCLRGIQEQYTTTRKSSN